MLSRFEFENFTNEYLCNIGVKQRKKKPRFDLQVCDLCNHQFDILVVYGENNEVNKLGARHIFSIGENKYCACTWCHKTLTTRILKSNGYKKPKWGDPDYWSSGYYQALSDLNEIDIQDMIFIDATVTADWLISRMKSRFSKENIYLS